MLVFFSLVNVTTFTMFCGATSFHDFIFAHIVKKDIIFGPGMVGC